MELLNKLINTVLIFCLYIWICCVEFSVNVAGAEPDINTKSTSQCPEPHTLIVKGFNVSFSDFIKSDKKLMDLCSNGVDIKTIYVLALNAVIFDRDLDAVGGKMQISVIAPKWIYSGERKVVLDGERGKEHSPPAANNGTEHKVEGEDGEPGLPGGNAGSFFGIAGVLDSANGSLTVTARGGDGGPGQNGGNGRDGVNGVGGEAVFRYLDSTYNVKSPYVTTLSFDCNGFGKPGFQYVTEQKSIDLTCIPPANQDDYTKSGNPWATVYYRYLPYTIYGESGSKGSKGGDGGKGGKGGHPCDITVFVINEGKNGFDVPAGWQVAGTNGKDGIGGAGGLGGSKGNDLRVALVIAKTFHIRGHHPDQKYWVLDQTLDNSAVRAESGKRGTDGGNSVGIAGPTDKQVDSQRYKVVNKYKEYARANLDTVFSNQTLLRFLNQIEINANVQNMYDTLGFADELRTLEEQLSIQLQGSKLLPHYQSLLKRIKEYAQSPRFNAVPKQYKKVLSSVYTAVLTRIFNIQDHSESNLIVDVSPYLKSIKENMETLKDNQHNLKSLVTKISTIHSYKEDYKNKVKKKIGEANQFIDNEIKPEIDKLNEEINAEIDQLVNEVLRKQVEAKEEEIQERTNLLKLSETLHLKGMMSCFEAMSVVASYCGPLGQAVSAGMTLTTTAAELTLADPGETWPDLSSLSQNVKELAGHLQSIRDEEANRLKLLLEEISEEASKEPETLKDLSEKTQDVKEKLDKSKSQEDVSSLRNELKDELVKEKANLEAKGNSSDAVDKMSQFSLVLEVGSGVVDVIRRYQGEKGKVKIVKEAIDLAKDKMVLLRQEESIIRSVVAPHLQTMEHDLKEIAGQLDNKSHVALDVTKWQVQSMLRDISSQISSIISTYAVKDDIVRCIKKLEDAMSMLISAYDHIQNYEEQQTLANYIADITSAAASDIHVSDLLLWNTTTYLDTLISSNLVLQQYQSAVDAFKQFVFPFAHDYFKTLVLPRSFQADKDVNGLIEKAEIQIKEITSKLDDYKHKIESYDEYIGKGNFSSHYISSNPFCVWKNDQYKELIRKMLAGQEVVVKADVMESDSNKEAIKFKIIEFEFTTHNHTSQLRLNELLKGFEVDATHLGNSYYRYNSDIYLMTTESQRLWYSYERDSSGEPLQESVTYSKLKQGDFMLSPYALWKLQLTNLTKHITYDQLLAFKDEVDLEMSGIGYYVHRRKTDDLDLQLDLYYKKVSNISGESVNVTTKRVGVSSSIETGDDRQKREAPQKLEDLKDNPRPGYNTQSLPEPLELLE